MREVFRSFPYCNVSIVRPYKNSKTVWLHVGPDMYICGWSQNTKQVSMNKQEMEWNGIFCVCVPGCTDGFTIVRPYHKPNSRHTHTHKRLCQHRGAIFTQKSETRCDGSTKYYSERKKFNRKKRQWQLNQFNRSTYVIYTPLRSIRRLVSASPNQTEIVFVTAGMCDIVSSSLPLSIPLNRALSIKNCVATG